MTEKEFNKNKRELKDYIYNKKWIEERLEDIKERKSLLDKITTTLSDMPKRKPKSNRQKNRKFSRNNG